jgi:primosomal protein N' (replication factor Y)
MDGINSVVANRLKYNINLVNKSCMYTTHLSGNLPLVAEPGSSYETASSPSKWVEALVYCPGIGEDAQNGEDSRSMQLYTYSLPPEMEVQPGDILTVPFGTQVLRAIAIRIINQPPANLAPEKIRDIDEVVSPGFLRATYSTLLLRVASYYHAPLMTVIKATLPPGLLDKPQRRLRLNPDTIPTGAAAFLSLSARGILEVLQASKTSDCAWNYVKQQLEKQHRINRNGAERGLKELLKRRWVKSYLEIAPATKPKLRKAIALSANAYSSNVTLTSRQREILKFLSTQGGGEMWLDDLIKTYKTTLSTLETLAENGCVVIQEQEILRKLAEPEVAANADKVLTDRQAYALENINNLAGYAQVLLHGVTGSGKTEVYLQAIAPVLAAGKSALVLVPEIGLTPQLSDRFRARFGSKVCIYHSNLSKGERYDTWRQMLAGEPQVVIGTRSAVFAPLPHLGLIILDEEHDSSFKQDQPTPTYHARTVAQWRAELENCPLILGSATPSLETWVEVSERGSRGELSNYQLPISNYPLPITHYLSLPERIQSRPLPPVEIVDMRQELREGNRSIFSRSLQDALQQLQEEQKQGILFIHRRGHSSFVSCRSCGYVMECPNCDVSLSYHYTYEGAPQLLRCHYCNFVIAHPKTCPECSSPYFKFFGSGTQRVEQELKKQFPQLRCIRFDSDTTRNKGSHRTLLTQFANGEADILLGTQMLTKGLDLPQVTLVGVVAADGLLHLSDYRASERAFQTLTQVAGRAGRGDDPGRAILQTYTPEHPVIQAAQHHAYEYFTRSELQQRAALNYPPYGRLILFRLSSLDEIEVENTALMLAAHLRPVDQNAASYEILGPAPASIMRVANRYRWQILIKFPPNIPLDLPDLTELRNLCPDSVSLTIDVDPLNFM